MPAGKNCQTYPRSTTRLPSKGLRSSNERDGRLAQSYGLFDTDSAFEEGSDTMRAFQEKVLLGEPLRKQSLSWWTPRPRTR